MFNDAWDRDDTSIRFKLNTFQKQIEAFNYANKLNVRRFTHNQPPTHVFSRECSNSGHRYFFVEDISSFYLKYKSMTYRDLTFYELLRAGFPCRIYFDIEFDRLLNPTEYGEASMLIFKRVLKEYIKTTLGFDISEYSPDSNDHVTGH